jgi:hypothetical protein
MQLTKEQTAQLILIKQDMWATFESHKAHFEQGNPGLTLKSTIGLMVVAIPKEDEAPTQKRDKAIHLDTL